MQFFILLVGVMVFVFYQYNKAPIFFNQVVTEEIYESDKADAYLSLEAEYDQIFQQKQTLNASFLNARENGDDDLQKSISTQIKQADQSEKDIRQRAREIISQVNPEAETNDKDYVFISFILEYMPKGIIGLLLAVILSAAMSSTSAELNALASTTTVDIYKRAFQNNASDRHYVIASKGFTAMWGIIALLFAMFGTLFENLIQFVNLIGSIFYGPVLGIFIAAFFIKIIKSRHVFWAALIAQLIVILCNQFTNMGFLWYNVIGCGGVILIALLIRGIDPVRK
jgi:hypothetical protein